MRGESTLNIEYSPDGKKKNFLLQPIVMHVIVRDVKSEDAVAAALHFNGRRRRRRDFSVV
jgi:hypothetical protein